ncbi:hypothetical protein [Streptomyces zhihengii]
MTPHRREVAVPHLTHDLLADLVLGNAAAGGADEALRHLARCGDCRGRLARLDRVVAAAHGIEEPDLPAAPPERVWREILRKLTPPSGKAEPAG